VEERFQAPRQELRVVEIRDDDRDAWIVHRRGRIPAMNLRFFMREDDSNFFERQQHEKDEK